MTTKNKAAISIMNGIKPPLPSIRVANSAKIPYGNWAIIPTIMINEIPLPIPLSVIFSPNHITNSVPAVKINIEEMVNNGSDIILASAAICELTYAVACNAVRIMVK